MVHILHSYVRSKLLKYETRPIHDSKNTRCRTLVDTNVLLLLYVLRCSVQGRLQAVLLCLRYVDTVAIGAWFVPSWCAQKNQVQKRKKKEKKRKKRKTK